MNVPPNLPFFKSVWSTYLKEELRFPNLIAASRSRLAVSRSSLLFCSLSERFSLMAAITAASACASAEVEPPPPPQAVSRDKARTPTRRRAASFFQVFHRKCLLLFSEFLLSFLGCRNDHRHVQIRCRSGFIVSDRMGFCQLRNCMKIKKKFR